MTNKELKKLSRAELLEMLLNQTKEVERLRAELDKTQRLLYQRQVQFAEAGNLAEAMISVNGIMDSAQLTANQYLENIAAMEEETRKKCEKMLRVAVLEARRIRKRSELRAAMSAPQREPVRKPVTVAAEVWPAAPMPGHHCDDV